MENKKGRWNPVETEKLRSEFKKSDLKKLSNELGRSVLSLRKKAIEIGLKVVLKDFCNWSRDEVELLQKLYPHKSTKEIAAQMKRTLSSVEQKAMRLGLKKSHEYLEKAGLIFEIKEWSRSEVDYLEKQYATKSLTEIAKNLDRPFTAVAQKAHRMGLKRVNRTGWPKEQIKLIKESFHIEDVKYLAKLMGRSPQSIRQKAHRLGLKRDIGNTHKTNVLDTAGKY